MPVQQDTPPPDGERGLGKGLLGVAGGLLAGAIVTHEIDEHKNKLEHVPGFKMWGHSNSSGGGGILSSLGRGAGAGALFSSFGRGGGGAATTSPAAPAGGMFSSFGNSGPPLHIHCAAYCDQDVTQQVRRMVTGSALSIDTGNIIGIFGDPWPGNRKQFSVIYSYGQRPWELAATAQDSGTFSLIPHQPLDNGRMKFIQDQRSRVIAVVWGTGDGLAGGKGALVKLQEIESSGEFPATNDWMGFDGMCGPAKTAVAYYRTAHGGVAISCARENGTVRMPWNPLARWT
jgi:hypothetical protein